MKGSVFNIRRYSVHDGPGIRVTIFMKGCPLNCLWCHNPEGISPCDEEIMMVRKVGNYEFIEKETSGRSCSIDDILNVIRRERVFIDKSCGGITFSGGEPLLQHDFLLDALKACRHEGVHTAVDTSGYTRQEVLESIMPYTDLFLYDIKHLDDAKHMEITGVSNELIISNYRFLAENSNNMFIRIPIVPGFNDQPEYLEELRSFIIKSHYSRISKICLLPFHRTGESKYRKLGLKYRMNGIETPTAERMKELQSFFSATGLKVKIGG
ncbi:MAG TPA: glycyl-radical enzyme activating protein [Bacteroidales bacterium]|nr:glycyl-radical enzyme activating protein [Bacteroidales bacterium]